MKRKTNMEKKIAGYLRPSNANRTIEFQEIEIPIPATQLNKASYKRYYEICTILNNEGRLRVAACVLIEILASSIDEFYRATTELEKGEVVITTASGHSYQNPYVSIRNTALNNVLKISKEFGLTLLSNEKLPEVIITKKRNDLIR